MPHPFQYTHDDSKDSPRHNEWRDTFKDTKEILAKTTQWTSPFLHSQNKTLRTSLPYSFS